MSLMIVIRASPACLKGLWSHTHTQTRPLKIHRRFGSRAFASHYKAPWSSSSGVPAVESSGELRQTCRQGRILGFVETSGASPWCHKWVCTQGCDRGALICMSTSCRSHTCKQRCSNVLIRCEINALAVPSDHVRAIVRAHLRYGSGPNALYQNMVRGNFKR